MGILLLVLLLVLLLLKLEISIIFTLNIKFNSYKTSKVNI